MAMNGRRQSPDGVSLRRGTSADGGFLRAMIYLALFVPPGVAPFAQEVVDTPELARIVNGFGGRSGDAG